MYILQEEFHFHNACNNLTVVRWIVQMHKQVTLCTLATFHQL